LVNNLPENQAKAVRC